MIQLDVFAWSRSASKSATACGSKVVTSKHCNAADDIEVLLWINDNELLAEMVFGFAR